MSQILQWLPDEPRSLLPAIRVLRNGGVIAYPTETVYGLGALMSEDAAVKRISDLKGREAQKPFSYMLSSGVQVSLYATNFEEYALALMAAFWPGPLTLVLNACSHLPEYAVSERKIGLRVPDHTVTRHLCMHTEVPITTTSANRSGTPPLVTANQVAKELGGDVDLIVDAGECVGKIPSTVVDATGIEPVLLREGLIPFAEILGVVKRKVAY